LIFEGENPVFCIRKRMRWVKRFWVMRFRIMGSAFNVQGSGPVKKQEDPIFLFNAEPGTGNREPKAKAVCEGWSAVNNGLFT